jgi:predicted nucleotide-binding protein
VRDVLDEVNHLLETRQDSLVPLLTKATRLAELCEEHEYKLLFQSHLNGIDPQRGTPPQDRRVEIWPFPDKQPRFDVTKMLFTDRQLDGDQVQGAPLAVIEQKAALIDRELSRIAESPASVTGPIITASIQTMSTLEKIRNRVSVFARVVETTLANETENSGLPTLRTIADGGRIFLGHGHSPVWRDVKDFLQDRLHLPWDEFNHETPAGKSNKDSLGKLLEHACFAFLVMTGEDAHPDGQHARENVIHEVGLFQGRLGFERAIVLLEDGCWAFSNIDGLGQIRFPKGDVNAKTEEIRQVLEREGILTGQDDHMEGKRRENLTRGR